VSTPPLTGSVPEHFKGHPDHYGPTGRSRWLDVDWRKHQRWVIVEGRPVNTIELGDGPPLVFVHGLSGSWQNWLEQLPVLADEHRVIALDLPGFGHSPMPAGEISIPGYARTLDALLEQLGVNAAAIVGNSMGGFIGSELAISSPQRVERLVLISSAGISTHHNPAATRAAPALRRLERIVMAAAGWTASKSDTVARRPRLRDATLNVVVRHPGRLPAALAAEQLRAAGKPGFMQALEAILDYQIRDRLGKIACPTLIVWGDHDRLVTVRDAHVFAELIPDSREVIFEDTGHMAQLERPARFNALLREFLGE
jgi:pimeloyl-ACP methyl ester carboxylesterase